MENNEEMEIDLLELASALLDKWIAILTTTVLGAVIALVFTVFFITPKYESSISFYVNNSSVNLGGTKLSLTTGDINAAQELVSTYIVILNTRNTLDDVAKSAHVDYSFEQLSSMISANAIDNTEVFKVTVTSSDPKEARAIAKTIGEVLPLKITSIIEGCSARIVDNPVVADHHSSPSTKKNTMIGALVGFVLSCAIVVIKFLTNDIIRTEDDLKNAFDVPVLASIPNLAIKSGTLAQSIYGSYGEVEPEILNTIKRNEIKGGNK